MKRILLVFCFISTLFLITGCTSDETELNLPKDIPEFVQENAFDSIDWQEKAVEFGDRNIIGNKNKSGIIGELTSSGKSKTMWHLWGVEKPRYIELTVVGYHRETETLHKILTSGWTKSLAGPNNGADAHVISLAEFPTTGEWAILLYTDDTLFDTLIYEIDD